ncbi:DUF7547 family protein [Halobaculum limi]|uniref:DUF7547 family protein n=1 Tax=Halobaculum limi TaxID=3031916 RepID=UPI002406ADCB|nr:hypothetical protein [Halobaculum sp. YSMS11]
MAGPARDPTDEDLAAVVSELSETLSVLQDQLDERDRSERRARSDRRVVDDRWERRPARDAPRPPAVGELFQFTSDYTIPTVVAVLEATIEALELLQGVIDLAAPGESPERRGRRSRRDRRRGSVGRSLLSDAVADSVSRTTDRAATDAADALARLRETLTEADLPNDEESRDLVADARELSAELERRVRESRATVDRERARERQDRRSGSTDRGPVTISVDDPDTESDRQRGESTDPEKSTESGSDASEEEEGGPEVDVDAELDSIKRQMGKHDADTNDDDAQEEDTQDVDSNDDDPDVDGDDTADSDDK